MQRMISSTAVQIDILTLLIFALVLNILALIWQHSVIQKQKKRLNVFQFTTLQLQDQLLGAAWNADILASQDFGRLKIAQMQILDKVITSSYTALSLLKKVIPNSSQKKADKNQKQ